MGFKRFTYFYMCCVLSLAFLASSCQKDQGNTAVDKKKAAAAVDTALSASPGANFLATGGTLTLSLQDSTYTFDAAKDSVAFVNISVGDNQYFGITAINKAHTMSFAISSKGTAATEITKGVEGSQLLLRPDAMHIKQYSLTQFTEPGDAGVLDLQHYRRDSVLAKGTFFTFLAPDDKAASPFYRVEGSFNLKLAQPKKQ
ncbi:hypothetical protein [Mucilaginibacter pedocola]|uniref:Uncharacterized protein n=1 Tax=Mucilaginibacter pedocola TaxID=1792845 RepID=A0A1S9P8E6_9SPHI|nr:hypothetical protein [Mucilaginibacter pedocola]OOQ57189.1 hypothetical protein BC343_16860 [Mucilaginibacter pedocola]